VLHQVAILLAMCNLIVTEMASALSVLTLFVHLFVMEHAQQTVTVVEISMDVVLASIMFVHLLNVVLTVFQVQTILVLVPMVVPTVIQAPILQILALLVYLATLPAKLTMIVTKLELVPSVQMVFV